MPSKDFNKKSNLMLLVEIALYLFIATAVLLVFFL